MKIIEIVKYLFHPKALLQDVKDHKVEIKGSIGFFFVIVLDLLIAVPIFFIIFGKMILEHMGSTGFIDILILSMVVTGFSLLFVPIFNLLVDAFTIFIVLKVFRSPVSYQKTILARTIGLIPLILLLPFKAIMIKPENFLASLFWPPWIGLFITLTNDAVIYPELLNRLIIDLTFLNTIRLVFTSLLIIWTVFRTSNSLHDFGEISKKNALRATVIQMILWDLISFGVAITFSLSFS